MMEIQVADKEYCIAQVHYECGKAEIDKKRDEVLEQFKRAPVKGFRNGKRADMTAIRLQYSREIDDSLKRALAEQAFLDTCFEKEIKAFGTPEFSTLLLERDKFSCDFSLRRKPEFEIAQYKDIEIPKPHFTLSIDAVAQEMLQELRIRYGESTVFGETDTVQIADNATVDYDVYDAADTTNTKIESLSAKAQLFTVGRSKLEGFDANIVGMKIGDTNEFTLKIPDIGLPSVAGKSLKFVATLIGGSKIKPNPLDDSLAVKIGKKDFQELQAFANEFASSKLQEQMRTAQVSALSARLVANHEIKVPEWLTLSEAQYLVAGAKVEWNTLPEIDQAQYLKMAENNVKLAMVLDKIRESEAETQLADQEVIGMIRRMVANMGKDSTEVDAYLEELNKSGQLVVLSARIRDEYALDFLVKNTKWIE
jgi:FKBP-type peptidyl-prolyl cis-trans isomerase (trigger factor)